MHMGPPQPMAYLQNGLKQSVSQHSTSMMVVASHVTSHNENWTGTSKIDTTKLTAARAEDDMMTHQELIQP